MRHADAGRCRQVQAGAGRQAGRQALTTAQHVGAGMRTQAGAGGACMQVQAGRQAQAAGRQVHAQAGRSSQAGTGRQPGSLHLATTSQSVTCF